MRIPSVVLVLVLASACTELPEFDEGCGNLVLDVGEDCDGDASGLCDENCSLKCSLLPEESCPSGYVCGADAFCHAPSGRFTPQPGSIPFTSGSYRVTDIDRDGYGDVVSLTSTSLDVAYGDFAATLAAQTSTLTPRALGAPAFTLLDADEAVDLLVPTANGLAGYSSQYQVMSPHSFTIDLDKPMSCPSALGDAFHVFAMDTRFLGLLSRNKSNGRLGFAIIDGAGKNACPSQPVTPICNIAIPELDPMSQMGVQVFVDVYDDAPLPSAGKVISVTLPGLGSCVFSAKHVPLPLYPDNYEIKDLTPGNLVLSGRPVLADIHGGGCPSLVDRNAVSGNIREYRGSGIAPDCALAATATPVPSTGLLAPAGATLIGHIKLSPSIASYGPDALMLSSGAYAFPTAGSVVKEVYRSDRKLDVVAFADLDLDGDQDAVGMAFGNANIDVLMRTSGDSYLLLRLDSGPAVGIELADYDGNEIADIAYIELLPSGRERLLIAYGTRDRPLEGAPVGAFARVVGLCRIQTLDASDPNNVVDDLIVLDLPFSANPALPRRQPVITLLHGSPQRSMLSYFDPRTTTGNPPSEFVGVAAGRFFATPDPANGEATDAIAVETTDALTRVWPFRATEPGVLEFTPSPPDPTAKLTMCATGSPAPTGVARDFVCADAAQYLTWPAADHDVVIAIENPVGATGVGAPDRAFAVLDPTSFTRNGVTIDVHATANAFIGTVDNGLWSRSLHAADVDGDRSPDLVASFGVQGLLDPTGKQGTVAICQVSRSGVPTSCQRLSTLAPELNDLTCVDAIPAEVAPRARGSFDHPPLEDSQNLIVLCHRITNGLQSELYRVHHDASGYHADLVFAQEGSIEKLSVGDVNGDGLDDVLALGFGGNSPFPGLLVITQCSSKDAVSCGVVAQ